MSDLGFYNEHDLYYFTYEYGNGDSYSGYGYTDPGSTYYTGQVLNNYPNETGNNGSYTIDSVETRYGYAIIGRIYVTSYYDGETGYSFGEYEISSGEGYSGLGSETGDIYSDSFSNYSEADFIVTDTGINNEVYYFTYRYGNGDSYSGYGYADSGTYYTGQILNNYPNETGNNGSYTIDFAENRYGYGINGQVVVTSYYDDNSGIYLASFTGINGGSSSAYVRGSSTSGLGSENGDITDWYIGSDFFSNYNEANVVYDTGTDTGYDTGSGTDTGYGTDIGSDTGYGTDTAPGTGYGTDIGTGYDRYDFTYDYGNGDAYLGYGYTDPGTYYPGQLITSNYVNQTGNYGQYEISSVYSGQGGIDKAIYIWWYFDGDTDNGTDTDTGTGYPVDTGFGTAEPTGLVGSENGYVYGNYISNYYEADVIGTDTGSGTDTGYGTDIGTGYDLYYFTYYYGNGDFYRGSGHVPSGTYSQGQQISFSSLNETGNYGYYTIDSVYSGQGDVYGEIYIRSYFDVDNGTDIGTGYPVDIGIGTGSPIGFVGYENGYVYGDYISNYYEADVIGTDTGTGTDTGYGTDIDTGYDTGNSTDTGSDTGYDTGAGTDTGSDTGYGTDTDTGSDTGYDTGTGSDTGAGSGTSSDTGTGTDIGGGTDTGAGSDTGYDTGISTGSGTGASSYTVLLGTPENNTLNATTGQYTVIPYTGDDTIVVNTASDVILELPNEGTDTIVSSVNYNLAAQTHIENLTLTGTDDITGIGNRRDNIITGNSGQNVLVGLQGDDTFVFNFGDSTIAKPDRIRDFGVGADRIQIEQQPLSINDLPSATYDVRTLEELVNSVFTDSSSASGLQPLEINSAALGTYTSLGVTNTYLIVNDGIPGFNAETDLVINIARIANDRLVSYL